MRRPLKVTTVNVAIQNVEKFTVAALEDPTMEIRDWVYYTDGEDEFLAPLFFVFPTYSYRSIRMRFSTIARNSPMSKDIFYRFSAKYLRDGLIIPKKAQIHCLTETRAKYASLGAQDKKTADEPKAINPVAKKYVDSQFTYLRNLLPLFSDEQLSLIGDGIRAIQKYRQRKVQLEQTQREEENESIEG